MPSTWFFLLLKSCSVKLYLCNTEWVHQIKWLSCKRKGIHCCYSYLILGFSKVIVSFHAGVSNVCSLSMSSEKRGARMWRGWRSQRCPAYVKAWAITTACMCVCFTLLCLVEELNVKTHTEHGINQSSHKYCLSYWATCALTVMLPTKQIVTLFFLNV